MLVPYLQAAAVSCSRLTSRKNKQTAINLSNIFFITAILQFLAKFKQWRLLDIELFPPYLLPLILAMPNPNFSKVCFKAVPGSF